MSCALRARRSSPTHDGFTSPTHFVPTAGLPPDTIFRPESPPAQPQPKGRGLIPGRTPRRAGSGPLRVRPGTPAHGSDGPALPRDRAILLRLAKLRVLSLAELQELVFSGRDRSRLSRRISFLEGQGWLQRWEEPRERGGRYRLVVPSATGLTWALRRLEETAEATFDAPLIRTMLRAGRMSPLALPPGRIPAYLPHLREVNRLLVEATRSEALRVAWTSSWPRSLPSRAGLRLPAPDGVLVLASTNGPRRLFFLEHDRATESLRSFARTKLDRYRLLASRPGLLEELTGYRAFGVVVTVGGDASDVSGRLRALRTLVRESFVEKIVRVVTAARGLEEPFLPEGQGVPAWAQGEAVPARLP